MKTMTRIFLMISILVGAESAQAQMRLSSYVWNQKTHHRYETALTPLKETYLKLLGRGIKNKITHEILAIACVSLDCKSLTYVYFSSDQKRAYYLYAYIDPVLTDGRLDEAATLQKIAKEFKFKLNYATFRTYDVYSRTETQTELYAHQFKQHVFNNWSAFTGAVTGSFSNTDGWNWSEKPVRVSNRIFESFLHVIDENPEYDFFSSIYSVRD